MFFLSVSCLIEASERGGERKHRIIPKEYFNLIHFYALAIIHFSFEACFKALFGLVHAALSTLKCVNWPKHSNERRNEGKKHTTKNFTKRLLIRGFMLRST